MSLQSDYYMTYLKYHSNICLSFEVAKVKSFAQQGNKRWENNKKNKITKGKRHRTKKQQKSVDGQRTDGGGEGGGGGE